MLAGVAVKISKAANKRHHPIPLLRLAMISLINPKSIFDRLDKKKKMVSQFMPDH